MAVAKVILNGTTLIDTTQKTVTAASMLNGITALKNDGTDITGNIASKTSSDLTASGATVTAPAGYYASSASKSVSSGSASTPATTITANPSISVSSGGLITASVSASKSVTPTVSAGYVSSGTAGTVSVSGSNTSQLTTQAAQTITPTTTNQTIASGKYLTGTQTILGDANLLAENIKKDVVIFGITGTYEGEGPSGYTVTISLTNPYHAGDFVSCTILQTDAVYSTTGVQIGSISSPTGSADVTFDPASQYTYLCVLFVGGYVAFNSLPTCSSGISYQDNYTGSEGGVWFLVEADGTITFDGIDYDG